MFCCVCVLQYITNSSPASLRAVSPFSRSASNHTSQWSYILSISLILRLLPQTCLRIDSRLGSSGLKGLPPIIPPQISGSHPARPGPRVREIHSLREQARDAPTAVLLKIWSFGSCRHQFAFFAFICVSRSCGLMQMCVWNLLFSEICSVTC